MSDQSIDKSTSSNIMPSTNKIKSLFIASTLSVLKMSIALVVLYGGYFIYSISGFTFIQGVEHSFKTKNSFTIYSKVSHPITDVLQTLPEEVASTCATPLVIETFTVDKKKDKTNEVEQITVSGFRASAADLEPFIPDIDIIAALKKVTSKVSEKESTMFVGSYGTKITIDGLYQLRPKLNTNNKKWQLLFNSKCIRITRYFKETEHIELGTDIIFKAQFSKATSSLRFSPLYVYVNNAYAKSLDLSISLNTAIKLQWISEDDHEVAISNHTDEFTLEHISIGQKHFLNTDIPSKLSMGYLRNVKFEQLGAWIPAPSYSINEITECIANNQECYFVSANLTFKFTEIGKGNNALSETISLMSN